MKSDDERVHVGTMKMHDETEDRVRESTERERERA